MFFSFNFQYINKIMLNNNNPPANGYGYGVIWLEVGFTAETDFLFIVMVSLTLTF